MRRLALVTAAVVGCGVPAAPAVVELRFTADTESEAYLCFGFAADRLGGLDIGAIALDAPAGPVTLHHVALYASPSAVSAGPVECEGMPSDAVPLHVWAIGGSALELPDDVELAVPDATQALIVQAHVVRYADGSAREGDLAITPREGALHRAGWLPLRAPTPALRPHHEEESVATCAIGSDLHVISTWPHMHEAGFEFLGSVVHGAQTTTYVDVDPWAYDAQRAYDVAVTLGSADQLETHCIWQNNTDETILPGPLLANEMCGQSLMAWPVEAAHCE